MALLQTLAGTPQQLGRLGAGGVEGERRLHLEQRLRVVSRLELDAAPVDELGPIIEHHERFPQRVNVGFARIRDRGNMDLRVFERGVGETEACGTGACAAVVTGQALGLLDDTVNVKLPGGQVVVSWRGGSEPVWLTGNAEYISEGIMDL